MQKKDWFGIGYVSIWVVIWGSIASFIDFPLLNTNVYSPGSIGQLTTFVVTAIISSIVAIWLFGKAINSSFVISALGLDTDNDN